VGWNVVEAAVALAAGIASSSIALVGFGLDSIIETSSGVALLWRFKQQSLSEHRAESRAVGFVGITFLALAAYVGVEAGRDLWLRRVPEFSLPGLILAILSLIVMPVLGVAKRRLARRLQSRALAADGLETLLCAYLSATLLVGLALNGALGWWWADPVAALAIAAFMVREGIEILRGETGDDAD
ncbi:MAG: cation transporter, partial [Acidobacteriia bacterium]|nr:cation transporter [Terriglobia bacterium]